MIPGTHITFGPVVTLPLDPQDQAAAWLPLTHLLAGKTAAPFQGHGRAGWIVNGSDAETAAWLSLSGAPLTDIAQTGALRAFGPGILDLSPQLIRLPGSLPAGAERHPVTTRVDQILFDLGYLRLNSILLMEQDRQWMDSTYYIRSDLLDSFNILGERSNSVVTIKDFLAMGRFANQIFMFANLFLYSLRNNCTMELDDWAGTILYGLKTQPCTRQLKRQEITPFFGAEKYLWAMEDAPVDVDFFAYFQELTDVLSRHRGLWRRLFRPPEAAAGPVDSWLNEIAPPGRTRVVLHVRHGDYKDYDHDRAPWFSIVPTGWYHAILDQVWPTLADPVLVIATDNQEFCRTEFARYNPHFAPDSLAVDKIVGFFPDFHVMTKADLLIFGNSSFSRMASLLAPDGAQACLIADFKAGGFVPYDPWGDRSFWDRFSVRPKVA